MKQLTERQAAILERALEMVQNGIWEQFQNSVREYTGQEVTDAELDELTDLLRG